MGLLKQLPRASKIAQYLQDGGGVFFSTLKGLHGGKEIPIKDAIKTLKKAGLDATEVEGVYKGDKEPSIFVSNITEEGRKLVEDLARKSGQESILYTNPDSVGEIKYISGDNAGKTDILEGFSFSDKPISSDFQTAIKTKQGTLYTTYGTGQKPAIHYNSIPGLTELDPAKAGTGVDAGKFKGDLPETGTSHFYERVGAEPEEIFKVSDEQYLGSYDPKKTYDFKKDPKKFLAAAQKMLIEGNYEGNPKDRVDLAKKLAKEAGYDHISWDMGGTTGTIIESFKKTPVIKGAVAGALGAGALGAGERAEASSLDRALYERATAQEKPQTSVDQILQKAKSAGRQGLIDVGRGVKYAGEAAMSGLEFLGEPQRRAAQIVAGKLGLSPSDQSSEAAFQTMVESGAESLGIPEQSTAGNVLKASAVTALEVFADPLAMLGPLVKAGRAKKVLKKALNVKPQERRAVEGALKQVEEVKKIASGVEMQKLGDAMGDVVDIPGTSK